MCGIYGYVGPNDAIQNTLTGLKKLEYRGYDSSGIAGFHGSGIAYSKMAGKIAKLEAALAKSKLTLNTTIAHTRWATHGKPNDVNAHPHFNTLGNVAIVHNGIIENCDALRHMLSGKGVTMVSETDSEVIAHLIALHYSGDVLVALQLTIPLLHGSFALAVIHKDHPNKIFTTSLQSPLIIGLSDNEGFVSSDLLALQKAAKKVTYLHDGEIAVVTQQQLEVFDSSLSRVIKDKEVIVNHQEEACKGDYAHFTLKEINEQPNTLRAAIASRFCYNYGTAVLEDLDIAAEEFLSLERIVILACGTSLYAGMVGGLLIEKLARISVHTEISSEYRYRNPIVSPHTLVIAISQSGETADTLCALRKLKTKGARVLSICNIHGSTITRESDACIYLKAGPEIGVASTKAFTSQVIVLSLLALFMGRMRHMDKSEGQKFLDQVRAVPEQVEWTLAQADSIQELAKKYAHFDNFFFLGRQYMYPVALEGALKLKEISYTNANGYPAGEIKHGPIALVNENCPTIAFCANRSTFKKFKSNLQEVHARSGPIVAVAEEGTEGLGKLTKDIIWIPKVCDKLAAIPASVVAQLFAYYVALERGTDIDQPRNLAKSVTVE